MAEIPVKNTEEPDAESVQPNSEPDRTVQPVDDEQPPRLAYPVVGIGASAGGIEAVTEFLGSMRPDSGMAFVLVQHLPPDRDSLMADILSKRTEMPVAQVEDGMPVEPDRVYVIRPGHVLTIRDGALHLGPMLGGPRAANRPIDDFFKSLAEEQRERAVCVIMSGMGSNGTAGAQAIKAVGGLCIAQDPESAQFPSMPRHLIDAGYADYILRPQDMPEMIEAYARHPYARRAREADVRMILGRDQHHLREILAVLRTRTRQEFAGYKKPTMLRRVQRRMGLARITRMGEYARMLRQSPTEVTALADDLLIHVTGFFRDAESWEALREQAIVPLIGGRGDGGSVRAWVSACSSGEEAYTLAMLLVEEADRIGKDLDIKVFATDMAERSLAHARAGLYPGGIEAEITPERLARYFQKEDAMYRVRPDLREQVVFAPQNILQDPPFSRMDLISCRNLLIYLEPDVQQRVLRLLHFGLREGGALFLGSSETVGGAEDMFEPIDRKARIFRRVGPTRHGATDFPIPHALRPGRGAAASSGGAGADAGAVDTAGAEGAEDDARPERRPAARPTLAQITQRTLFERHLPAAVLVDRGYRVLYFQGNTGPFLEQPTGEPTRDLMAMAREGVRGAARVALHRAAAGGTAVTVRDGWTAFGPGGTRSRIAVTASPAADPRGQGFFVVSFELLEDEAAAVGSDGGQPAGAGDAGGGGDAGNGQSRARELRHVREELQRTIEELQTSNEELKASHEEVTSINEELQSSNEELETSKEEMQSLNEELTTVNAQLQAKMEEHHAARNDLASLLASTDIAVVFLDRGLRIRRFTPAVKMLFDMIASDVGRPLKDLAWKFADPELAGDTQAVLERLVPAERVVQADGGRWFLRRVTPYRTAEDVIEGVVVAFIDITERRRAEEALRASEEQFRRAIEDAPAPVILQAQDGEVLQVSRAWTELTGYELSYFADAEAWLTLAYGPGAEAVRSHMYELFKGDRTSLDVEFDVRRRDGARRRWSFSASAPGTLADGRRFMVGVALDITDRHHMREALTASEERFRLLVEGAPDFAMLMLDAEARITAINGGAVRLLGYSEAEAVGQPGAIIFTPEDRAKGAPEQEAATAARTGHAVDERWHLRKDGTRFWGSGAMNALREPDGSVKGFVKVLRDSTERKLVVDALDQARRDAEAANVAKDEFLATVSHELRTPLAAILLWAKLLRGREPGLARESIDALDSILRSAESQGRLIDDLLDMSRITSGRLRLIKRDADVPLILRSAVDAFTPTASAKGVTLATDIKPEVGTVRADPDRVRQIVWNLLDNAVKFTPAGGTVTLAAVREGKVVQVRVSDTGKGISREFLPDVFDRFRQADPSLTRTAGGLGLGLAIIKQLVELHGGTVTAESEGVGRGSSFVVRLPLPRVRISVPPALPAGATDPQGLRDVHVLVAEDDEATRYGLASLLKGAGARVSAAASAADAIELFRAERPDLILSDIGMPEMDGYLLLREIRAIEAADRSSPVPAVALTAFTREEDRRAAIDNGYQQHVAKPIDPDELVAVLVAVLRAG